MRNRIYSDLAIESGRIFSSEGEIPKEYSEEKIGELTLCKLILDSDELSKKYGRRKGSYVTLCCGRIWLCDKEEIDLISSVVSREIRSMLLALTKKELGSEFSVLAVGLGNPHMTPDAIGPLTVSHLKVNRHIKELDSELFSKLGMCSLSAMTPGVLSQTGIETLDIIKDAVKNIRPNAVIAVDALAARSCDRLGSTVQLSSDGICPGSGIGNHRRAISQETLGVPVIALGVPTVVDSATLVYDALEKAEITDNDGRLDSILQDKRGFFVSPKESDLISDSVGIILGNAINSALSLD
ncbi:MAG: GPR endopeptidase [Ruminococcaceae bacterium]|nr:GPR endopeptidase [Oscillospiraceae bacterium]